MFKKIAGATVVSLFLIAGIVFSSTASQVENAILQTTPTPEKTPKPKKSPKTSPTPEPSPTARK